MACDGVWDVMGNDEACFFLRKSIQEGSRDLGKILQDLEVFRPATLSEQLSKAIVNF